MELVFLVFLAFVIFSLLHTHEVFSCTSRVSLVLLVPHFSLSLSLSLFLSFSSCICVGRGETHENASTDSAGGEKLMARKLME